MKKILSALILTSLFIPATLASDNKKIFTDLDSNHENYEAIKYLKEHYIIHGHPDGSFHSEDPVNRAEALKMIILSANYHIDDKALEIIKSELQQEIIPATENSSFNAATEDIEISPSTKNNGNQSYTDIETNHWFFPYVMKASQLKIVAGYPDGTFKPGNQVNLAESLKMILISNNASIEEKVPGNPYQDVPLDAWHSPYFYYFKSFHLLNSTSEGNVYPDKKISRGELCELIYRYIKRETYQDTHSANGTSYIYGKSTHYGEGDGFHGRTTATGTVFDKNGPTAAHRSLPFGTKLKVINIENGKSTIVTITDRGPYDYRFILDLSSGSFAKIAPLSQGFIDVKIEILED